MVTPQGEAKGSSQHFIFTKDASQLKKNFAATWHPKKPRIKNHRRKMFSAAAPRGLFFSTLSLGMRNVFAKELPDGQSKAWA